MTNSNEAIAAAREIVKKLYAHEADHSETTVVASTIQKHYAAKEAERPPCNCVDWGATGCLSTCDSNKTWKDILQERDQLKRDIFEIRHQHQQEANEWKTDEELTYERDQLKARVAELEKLLKMAECPECDGSGGRQISEAEAVQCRFCYERSLALSSSSDALARLQELERKAKALDFVEQFKPRQALGKAPSGMFQLFKPCSELGAKTIGEGTTALSAIESAMEKQK